MPIVVKQNGRELRHEVFTFNGGERHIKFDTKAFLYENFSIFVDYRSSDDLIDLILIKEYLDNWKVMSNDDAKIKLIIPYFPYGRQDRRCNWNESHSLKAFSNVINSLGFDRVYVCDPHSDVIEALIKNVSIISQESLAQQIIDKFRTDERNSDYVFLAPDAGALKKIYKLAELYPHCSVVCANKIRDLTTGKIIATRIYDEDFNKLKDKVVWVVDDIADASGTFIALANELGDIKNDMTSLNLYVTHGIFANNAKQRLKEAGYDTIVAYFDRTEDEFFKNLKG